MDEYIPENMAELRERVEGNLARIRETLDEETIPMPFRAYFLRVAEFLLSVTTYAENRSLFADILPDHYARSYANPDYASGKLGPEYGPLLSSIYVELRGIIPALFEGREEERAILYELFLELYFEFENEDLPSPETVRAIYGSYLADYTPKYVCDRIRRIADPAESFETDILEYADLSGAGYLYSYGEYISPKELKTAERAEGLSEEAVESVAQTVVETFRSRAAERGTDFSGKKSVRIVYELGTERVVREVIHKFREMGLEPTVLRRSSHLVTRDMDWGTALTGASPNGQLEEDHREDLALVLDSAYVSMRKRVQQEAFEAVKDLAGAHAGAAVLDFSDVWGKPRKTKAVREPAKHAIRMSKEQRELDHGLQKALAEIGRRYMPAEGFDD